MDSSLEYLKMAYVFTSDRGALVKLRACLDGFPGESNVYCRISPTYVFDAGSLNLIRMKCAILAIGGSIVDRCKLALPIEFRCTPHNQLSGKLGRTANWAAIKIIQWHGEQMFRL